MLPSQSISGQIKQTFLAQQHSNFIHSEFGKYY